MFQQTLDIFDPLYVPNTAEEKKILVESGGWRRLKQKIPGRSCISVGNANNQVDLYVEDPLDMHKCGDDVIYDCYRRAISLMLKAEENDSWPIHGIRSWLSSHMAEILQQINNKFIAFPHTPYKKAFDKKIVTEVKPLEKFYYAEEYHQDYEVNNPNDPYIMNISKPRFKKFKAKSSDLLKKGY